MAGWLDKYKPATPEAGQLATALPAAPSKADWLQKYQPAPQELTAPTGAEEKLNFGREADAYARGGASIKMTQPGVVNWLGKQYGADNVATDKDGAVFLRDPEKREWYPLDSNNITAQDFTTDMVGPALEAAPTVLGGGIMKAMGLGAAGNVIRQGLSGLMGGSDEMSLGDRAASTGVAGAVSGASEVPFAAGAAMRNAVAPMKVAGRYGRKAMDTPEGQIGQRLEDAGVPLSLGEKTLDPNILQVEGMLRRKVGSMGIVREAEKKQLGWATQKLQGLMDQISKNPASADLVGQQVNDTFKGALDKATGIRASQAKADFAKVNSLAGEKAFIQPANTVAKLDELIGRYATPGGGDRTAAIAKQLEAVRDSMSKPRSAVEMERLLEVYSGASQGSRTAFKNIDTAQERSIAAQVVQALDADLAAAASQPGTDAMLANELQIARQNYAQNSQPIDELRRSVLGQFLGNRAGEVVPTDVFTRLKGMDGPSLKRSLRLLETADPQIAQTVKRGFLEEAFQAAYAPTDQALVRLGLDAQEPFSPKKFTQVIKQSPIWPLLEGKERGEAEIILTGLGRMASKMGEGSPTAPLLWAMDLVKNAAKAATLDPAAAAELAVSVLAPRKAAQLLMSPEGRQALLTVTNPNPLPRRAAEALTTIAALGGRDFAMSEQASRPNPDLDLAMQRYQQQGLPAQQPQGLGR